MKFIKTKNIFALGITISFVFFLTFLNVNAQEETSSSSTDSQDRSQQLGERIENREENKEARVETRQEFRTERQGALQKIRQERILNLSANISNRMDAAIVRLGTITNRLESRIQKISDSGKNTEAASAKLNEAKTLINEAKAKIVNIDTLVYEATTSNEPHYLWQNVRQTYKEVSQLIRTGRVALQETIALLKISLNEIPNGDSGTSTEDITNTSTEE